jgi:hypothetical protein
MQVSILARNLVSCFVQCAILIWKSRSIYGQWVAVIIHLLGYWKCNWILDLWMRFTYVFTFKSSWSRFNASEICVYRDVQISSLLVETIMKWCSIQIWITIQKTDSEASVHRLWMAWSHGLGIAGCTTFFIGGTSGQPVQAFLGHLTLEESRIMQRRSANLLDGTRTFHIITCLPYL